MSQDVAVSTASDLQNLFPDGCVELVSLPATDADLGRLHAGLFARASQDERLLITSTTTGDFSWELVNRLLFTAPGLSVSPNVVEIVGDDCADRDHPDSAILVLPGAPADTDELQDARRRAATAVILARSTVSLRSDVATLTGRLRTNGFTVRGVVVVGSKPYRWRKWRRFARSYGVWSDPDRPWPAIDVLDEEKVRTARRRKGKR